MRKLLIASAALMAMSVPAQADGLSGWGEAQLGLLFGLAISGAEFSSDWAMQSGESPKLRGGVGFAVNLPIADGGDLFGDGGGGWNFQVDGFGGGGQDENNNDFLTRWGVGGIHGFYRDPDHAYGIFAGAAALMANDDSATGVVTGIEAAWFDETSTWILQGGYVSRVNSPPIDSDADYLSHGGLVRVLWRKFFDDDMMLQLGITAAMAQMDEDQDEGTVGVLQAGFEHIPEGWPVSYFTRLTSTVSNQWEEGDVAWNNEVMLGLRLYFGHETLKSNDRTGTTFDLPPFVHIQETGVTLE